MLSLGVSVVDVIVDDSVDAFTSVSVVTSSAAAVVDATVVGDVVVDVVVVVVDVVDLNGLNGFGLSSVILISSGFVISLILMPSGFSLASCNMESLSLLLPLPLLACVLVTGVLMITSFFDNFESASLTTGDILTSSEKRMNAI